jgi:hypothetical protein
MLPVRTGPIEDVDPSEPADKGAMIECGGGPPVVDARGRPASSLGTPPLPLPLPPADEPEPVPLAAPPLREVVGLPDALFLRYVLSSATDPHISYLVVTRRRATPYQEDSSRTR